MQIRLNTLILLAPLAVCASCTAPAEESGEPAADTASPDAAATDEAAGPPEDADRVALANTAWRVQGEDGAIYTTYLDADGTYRDFKNGESLQEGSWEEVSEGRLCFTPADEERTGECWSNERQEKDGTMRTTSDSERTVELRQVTYVAASLDGE